MISSPASSIVGIVTGQTGRRSERETWRRLPFSPCLVLRLKSRTNTRIICYCVMWSAPGLSGWPGWASPAFDSLHVVFDRGHPTHGAGGTTHVPRGMPPLSLLQLRGEGLAVQLCEARSYSARTPPSDPNCARHVLPPPHTHTTNIRAALIPGPHMGRTLTQSKRLSFALAGCQCWLGSGLCLMRLTAARSEPAYRRSMCSQGLPRGLPTADHARCLPA